MSTDFRLRVVVVYPQVAEAIAERRKNLGLPAIPVDELRYGQDEVMQIVNRLNADLLQGSRATIHGLLDIITEGYDVVWLVTHADEDGWYLEDGVVNASETTAIIRASGAFLTVMNTCSSLKVAREAASEIGTAFICTVREVPDRQAYITGVLFAQKLSAGIPYEQAYELAKPGQNSNYELIRARYDMPQGGQERRQWSDNRSSAMPDAETLHKFIRSVEDLNIIVKGSTQLDLPPLKELIRQLQKQIFDVQGELTAIKTQLNEMKDRQRIRTWAIWIMAIVIAGLLVTVAILVSQLGR